MGLHFYFTPRDAKHLLFGLILIEIFLVAIFVADTLLGQPKWTIHVLFDLDGEGNIPAWFSSVQLFLIGLVFFLKGRQSDPDYRPSSLFFLIVGAGFIFLSVDEAAAIHEKITHVLTPIAWVPRFKGDHGVWVFIYILVGVSLCFATYRDLMAMWKRYRSATSILAVGMGLFLIGVIGLEIVSFEFLRSGSTPLLYQAEVALEELLEMSGESIMLYGTLLLAPQESGPRAS